MSSVVRGIVEVVVGIAAIALTIVAGPAGPLAWAALAPYITTIAAAGAGLAIAGVGTLINGTGNQGSPTGTTIATMGGIQPWRYVYGQGVRVGGDLIYEHEWGDSDKYRDMVFIIACHPTQAVRRLLFDNQFVQIDQTDNTSFTPVQQTVNITSITRANNVVTVVLAANIPFADVGVDVEVQNVTGDHTLNGKVMIDSIVSQIAGTPGSLTFTYLSGGTADTFSGQGQVKTIWPDYGRKVYMEVLDGTQTSTFNGMLSGTPNDGDNSDLINDGSNPWTSDCIAFGHTAVFLRLHYNDPIFVGGMPTVGFIVDGKNNIYDPRTGTTGFTRNAALCTADFAADIECGFGLTYHAEIPDAQLIAAANICDETVALAGGGTTLRYTCDGQFTTATLPGTILLNMLTACAGKWTNIGGQFVIWPAAWRGTSPTVVNDLGQYSGAFEWSPRPSARELYNGVKGTFYSPSNRWQVSDFPAYTQDYAHGYNIGDTTLTAYGGDANLRADQNQRLYLDIQLPFTSTAEMCQRIAKIELERRRAFGVGTFRLNMTGFPIMPVDVLAMTNPVLGWTDYLVEVNEKRFSVTKQSDSNTGAEAMALGVEIDVASTSAGVYFWDPNEAQTPQGYRAGTAPTMTLPVALQPPSQIQTFALTSGYPQYDSQDVILVGTGAFPVQLNNFAGGKIWNVLAGDFDHPIFMADCPLQTGDTVWNWQVKAPAPAADVAWQLYAVAYGIDPVTGTVVSGPWLPVATPSSDETPHITVAIAGAIPGKITAISTLAVDQSDPLVSVLSGTATPPSPLNGFIGSEIYYKNITSGSTDTPHDTGQFPQYDGSGTYTFSFKIPSPPTPQTWRVWFVSANQSITEILVTSGADESATADVNVGARAGLFPVAETPASVTVAPTYRGASWGFNLDAAPPVAGWATDNALQVNLIRTSPAGFQDTPYIAYNIPTGTTHFISNTDPNYERPDSPETWQAQLIPIAPDGTPGVPVLSAPFTVDNTSQDTTIGSDMFISGLICTRNSPPNYSADGIEQMQFTAVWTEPTNPDAYSIRITVINTSDPSDIERPVGEDDVILAWSSLGGGRSGSFGPWACFAGTYKFTFYTINEAGDQLGGANVPFKTIAVAPHTGKVNIGRADPTTFDTAAFQITSGKYGIISGGLPNNYIAAVAAGKITGSIVAGQIGSVSASVITGAIISSQIGSVSASTITGTILASQITSITAGQITGTITSSQIGSVSASTITGFITAGQITSLTAAQITGLISSSQINTITAAQISGSITSGQIASVNATAISGSITSGQIASVTAGSITGVIVSSQLTSQILNSLSLVGPGIMVIASVSSLPTLPNVNYPNGCFVLNTTSKTIFKNNAGSWTAQTASSTITGNITSTDITSVSAGTLVGLVIASQIQTIAATQITGTITASQIVSIAATQITGTINATQIGTISGSQITSIVASTITVGQITSTQISSVAAGTILAGTINASISMTAPTITVNGSGFTINIDSSNGVKVSSSTNSSTVSLQPGFAQITGTGSFAGFANKLFCEGVQVTSSSTGASVQMLCLPGNSNTLLVSDGSFQWSILSSTSSGHILTTSAPSAVFSMLGSNSVVNINGSVEINGTVMLDTNKLHRFNTNQWDTVSGSMPSTFSKRFYVYDENGSFVGFVPIM